MLGLCAAPELDPRYGRLYAYLHDDVTRKLPSPRLVARLLAGDGVPPAEVLALLRPRRARCAGWARCALIDARRPDAARRARRSRSADAAGRAPARRRARRAGAGDGRLRREPCPRLEPGRDGIVRRAARAARARQPPAAARRRAGRARVARRGARAGRSCWWTSPTRGDAGLMREARSIGGARGPPALLRRASRRSSPARGARRCARWPRATSARSCARPPRAPPWRSATRTAIVVEVPLPTLRGAARGLGGAARARTTWTTWRRSSASRSARSPTRPRSPATAAAARARPRPGASDLDLGARQRLQRRGSASSPSRLEPALRLGRPRAAGAAAARCSHSISAYLRHRDLVLVRVGLRAHRRARPGPEDAVRRRVGHGQDDGRPGARARPRPGALPHRPRDGGLEVHRGDREEPRPHLRRRRGLERDPVLRRGRRALRQALRGAATRTTATRTSRSRTCCRRWRATRAPSILATNFRHNIDEAFLRRLDFVIDFPFPEAEDRERIWRLRAARRGAASTTTSTSPSWRRSSSSPAAASATPRSPRRSSPPRTAA